MCIPAYDGSSYNQDIALLFGHETPSNHASTNSSILICPTVWSNRKYCIPIAIPAFLLSQDNAMLHVKFMLIVDIELYPSFKPARSIENFVTITFTLQLMFPQATKLGGQAIFSGFVESGVNVEVHLTHLEFHVLYRPGTRHP